MLTQLTRADVWRALLAGLGYAALYAAASGARRACARWLTARTRPGLVWLQLWRGWPWLGELLGALGTLACAALLAFSGVLASGDLGLAVPEPAVWRWMLGITLGGALWLGLLALLAQPTVGAAERGVGDWSVWLLRAVYHEGRAAIWRGALAPWVGGYWGVWLAPLAALVTTLLNSAQRAALRDAQRRAAVLLAWALDWLGAALFAYTRSAWAAAAGRAICGVLVWLVLQRVRRDA